VIRIQNRIENAVRAIIIGAAGAQFAEMESIKRWVLDD
jgi:hypothetical protein